MEVSVANISRSDVLFLVTVSYNPKEIGFYSSTMCYWCTTLNINIEASASKQISAFWIRIGYGQH